MPDVAALVASLGGIAQKQQLVARGVRDLDLTRAIRDRSVTRPRQGWYTTLDERDPSVRAVRVGGRLTGISAIQALGGWVLGEHPLHVSVPENASRLRSPWNRRRRLTTEPGVRVHWDAPEVSDRGTVAHVGLVDALFRVIMDESVETAVAAVDWALHMGVLDYSDFAALMSTLPENRQQIRALVDGACESLPESLSRTRLTLAGHRVVSQVRLGNQRIDLLVDDIVGLEVDGEAHHWDRFLPDRQKDLAITRAGYRAIRVPAVMVFHHWDAVLAAIEAALEQHRPPSKTQEMNGMHLI